MNHRICLAVLLPALLITACERSDIGTFKDEMTSVRFAYLRSETDTVKGADYSAPDSTLKIAVSFLDYPGRTELIYRIPLVVVGTPADRERNIGYEVLPSSQAEDYEIIGASIPANSHVGAISVRLKKTDKLNDSTYTLNLRLTAEGALPTGPDRFVRAQLMWNNLIPAPPQRNLRVTYNMLVKSPLNFASSSTTCYSPNAMHAIVEALQWNDWDDAEKHGNKANGKSYGSYKYLPQFRWIYADSSYKGYAATLKDYLADYEKTHGQPLRHDAGKLKGQPVEARSY